jgi:TonB family protein
MAEPMVVKVTPSAYGAKEIKEFIRKNTWKGFFITAGLMLILVLLNIFAGGEDDMTKMDIINFNPVNTMTLEEIATPDDVEEVAPPPDMQQIINTGPAARAGNPVPVPDAQITPDMQEFATMDVMSRASAEGGSGVDLGEFSSNINFDESEDLNVKKVEEPAMDEFIPVEKQPQTDMAELQKSVVYPEMAKKAGIEGKVTLRVLVDTDGSVRKVAVIQTDSQLLVQAAKDAVSKAVFTPAIQNNQPVMVWVSIPITFKLR